MVQKLESIDLSFTLEKRCCHLPAFAFEATRCRVGVFTCERLLTDGNARGFHTVPCWHSPCLITAQLYRALTVMKRISENCT